MNFRDPEFKVVEFQKANHGDLKNFPLIFSIKYDVEGSVPWINIMAIKVKPKEALEILESLQATTVDKFLINQLHSKEKNIIVNGEFYFNKQELSMELDH